MKKQLFTLPKIFLLYLGVVLGYFLYAGITGTRMLGDDTEKYDPNGPGNHQESNRIRTSRFYHK